MSKLFITLYFLLHALYVSAQYNEGDFTQYLDEVKASTKANQTLWAIDINAPILFVDPISRRVWASEKDKEGQLSKSKKLYAGVLPPSVNIANTAIQWSGKRWAMIMLPLPEQKQARLNLITHELFHQVQPEIGFGNLGEKSNAHLDTYDGRLLLRLELQALVQAVQTTDQERSNHIANALRFRKERQTSDEIKKAENSLELNEGLAEYTGAIMSGRTPDETKAHFKNSVELFYQNQTFVRSFAYQTVPMYGYLLSQTNNSWQQKVTRDTNLTDYFENAFSLEIDITPTVETIAQANNYQFEQIQKEEQQRETERLEVIGGYKNRLLQKPTLKLIFEKMQISFDPRNIIPIDDIGTVYPTLRVTDNWGILTVENGALLSANWSNVIVSEPTSISDNLVKGDGWTLELNENWVVEQIGPSYELKSIR